MSDRRWYLMLAAFLITVCGLMAAVGLIRRYLDGGKW